MGRVIKKYDKSIVVASDVKTLMELENLIKQTCDVQGIGAYKVGSILAVKYGLPM